MMWILVVAAFLIGYGLGRGHRQTELEQREQLARIRGQREGMAHMLVQQQQDDQKVVH